MGRAYPSDDEREENRPSKLHPVPEQKTPIDFGEVVKRLGEFVLESCGLDHPAGEYRALRLKLSNDTAIKNLLSKRYGYLAQLKHDAWFGDLADTPLALAYRDTAEALGSRENH